MVVEGGAVAVGVAVMKAGKRISQRSSSWLSAGKVTKSCDVAD